MNIEDFLTSEDRFAVGVRPEVDGLAEPGALQEAVLVDLRLNVVESTAWLLLDCRGALDVPEANTAVVVLAGAGVASWELPAAGTFAWQVVVDWDVTAVSGGLELRIGLLAGGHVVIRAMRGEYFVGDVPGGDGPPPDFTTASAAEVRRGMARWSSPFEVRAATSVAPPSS